MYLKSLKLAGFRSYSLRELAFSQGLTLIVGPNTAGKTNVLEAVVLLARGHSFRGDRDEEMVNWREESGAITGVLDSGEELTVVLTRGLLGGAKAVRKRYLLNGVGKRAMDFVGKLAVVLFEPGDLQMIVGSPSLRRSFLDEVLTGVSRDYRRAELAYRKALRRRNRLLEEIREGRQRRESLYFWDRLLVENGNVIIKTRREFLDFVSRRDNLGQTFLVKYKESLISPGRLEKYAREEVAAGRTLVGPHRDDFEIGFGDGSSWRNLALFGSRGEQRLAVLGLKLAELEFATEKMGERPVLLLDDIFSELDEENRKKLLEVLPKQQVLMTTTGVDLGEELTKMGGGRLVLGKRD